MVNNKKGFTLVEMIIVLGLTVALMIIGYQPMKKALFNYQEKIFFTNLQRNWDKAAERAIEDRCRYLFLFEEGTNKIYVRKTDRNGILTEEELIMPKSLQLYKTRKIRISQQGSVTGDTVTFVSNSGKTYVYTFQLGYGARYNVLEK